MTDNRYYEKTALGDLFRCIGNSNKKIQLAELSSRGKYPVISQGKNEVDGWTDDADKVIDILPAILFGDHTRKVQYINQPFVPGADGTKILFSESLFPRYFYYLVAFAVSHMDSRGYGRHFALLKKAEIPVALLKSHQIAIANYLDKAFALLEKIKKKQEELQHMALVLKKSGSIGCLLFR